MFDLDLDTNLLYTLIFAGLLVTTVFFLWAVWELAAAADQRRALAQRSALYEMERRANSPLARFDTRVRRTDFGRRVEERLVRSGLQVQVGTFVATIVGVVLLTVFLLWNVFGPVFGVVAAAAVVAMIFSYLRKQEERRREDFVGQLPELARVLSNATSAGLALPTAVSMAADELGEPAGTELKHMSQSLKFGQSFQSAIEELQTRMPSREISVLASTLLVSSRAGGSLVTALRNIAETLEKRKETRREIKTILSETTSTTWGMAFMGVVGLLVVHGIYPGGLDAMSRDLYGVIVLAVFGVLFTTGILLIRRITRFKI